MRECATLNGLETGYAKITKGYRLPARYIIHAVGPTSEDSKLLASCYNDVLEVARENKVRTVAFCCISTGIFGYPLGSASRTALSVVRNYLETNGNYKQFDRIVFVVFLAKEELCYNQLLPCFFPLSNPDKNPIPRDPVAIEEEKERLRKAELEKKKIQSEKLVQEAQKHTHDPTLVVNMQQVQEQQQHDHGHHKVAVTINGHEHVEMTAAERSKQMHDAKVIDEAAKAAAIQVEAQVERAIAEMTQHEKRIEQQQDADIKQSLNETQTNSDSAPISPEQLQLNVGVDIPVNTSSDSS